MRSNQVKTNSRRAASRSRKKEETQAASATSGGGSSCGAKRGSGKPAMADQAKPALQVKQECAQRVVQEMGNIVNSLIEKAKDGSCQHAKFLFDFAGVEESGAGEESPSPGESLLELLLRRLDAQPSGHLPQATGGERLGDAIFHPASGAAALAGWRENLSRQT